jgi:inorganic pyrophosphatase
MSFANISPGKNPPEDINVIIEIPANSGPTKYEMDKENNILVVDRLLTTAMYYPCNYGFIPGTLSEDGDPVDVLVLTPVPLISGSLIRSRPVGLMRMTDESGIDNKILAVPVDKLSPLYSHIKSPDDLPTALLSSFVHFFEHYKDLEPGKWVKVNGWYNVDEAHSEIIGSIKRYIEHNKDTMIA